jgi:DNA-binding transcriptional LysR family regulator
VELPDLRTADVWTFLSVRRCGTVTGASRELKVTPSQVSKSVARLERQLKIKLLTRTGHGMVVSESAQRLVPHMEEIISRVRHLPAAKHGSSPELTIAAPSALIDAYLPLIAECQPGVRVRGVLLAPPMIRLYASERLFDMALGVGPEALPPQWVSQPIGQMKKALFATPEVAAQLGAHPIRVERMRGMFFVTPIATSNGQFVPADDDCPLGFADRRVGHQAATFHLGLELAARSGQLIFGPRLAARPFLDSGRMVEIPVDGWDVREDLFVVSDGDRVLAKSQKEIVLALRAATQRLA